MRLAAKRHRHDECDWNRHESDGGPLLLHRPIGTSWFCFPIEVCSPSYLYSNSISFHMEQRVFSASFSMLNKCLTNKWATQYSGISHSSTLPSMPFPPPPSCWCFWWRYLCPILHESLQLLTFRKVGCFNATRRDDALSVCLCRVLSCCSAKNFHKLFFFLPAFIDE